MSNGSSTGPLRKLKLFVAPDLPLHHRVISWLEFMWEDGNKMSRRCVCACTVHVCSHRVSGVVDNSAQRRGRESLPPQTLMSRLISVVTVLERPRKGERKHVLLSGLPLFWLEAFLITCRIVIAPIGIVWASNSSKLEQLPYFSNVFSKVNFTDDYCDMGKYYVAGQTSAHSTQSLFSVIR